MKAVDLENQYIEESIRIVPDFPKPGIMFRDISTLLARPKAFKLTCDKFHLNFWAAAKAGKVCAIAGVDARGFIFGSILSDRLDLPFLMIRKAGKLPVPSHKVSYSLEYGEATLELSTPPEGTFSSEGGVVVVDDLLATGGSAKAAGELFTKAGGKVAAFAFVVELEGLEGKSKLEAAFPESEVFSILSL